MKHVRLIFLAVTAMIGVATIAIVSAQDSPTANVEVRVWQSTSDAERLYISARPEDGSWGRTIPLDMSGKYKETFLYGDITVEVPLPEVVAPSSPSTPLPSDSFPVTHYDCEGDTLCFVHDYGNGDPIAWRAVQLRDGNFLTTVTMDVGPSSSRLDPSIRADELTRLEVQCYQGVLSIVLEPGDFLSVTNTAVSRADIFHGVVTFQIAGHEPKSQAWYVDSHEGSISPVLRSKNPEALLAEMRDRGRLSFFGSKHIHSGGGASYRVRTFDINRLFGTPVQWNIDNCGNY